MYYENIITSKIFDKYKTMYYENIITSGDLDKIKELLDDNWSRFFLGNSVAWASEVGHIETVKLILTYQDIDPTYQDNNALRWAIKNGHSDVIVLLLADQRIRESLTTGFLTDFPMLLPFLRKYKIEALNL